MWRILTGLFFFLAKIVSSGFIETPTSRSSSCTGSLSFHHYRTDEFITKITDTSLRIVLSSGRDQVKIKIEGNCCFYVFNKKKCRGELIRTSTKDSMRPSSHIGEISAVKISSWENGCRNNQSMVKKFCREKMKDFQNVENSAKYARQEQVVSQSASETNVTVNKTEQDVLDATEPMIQNRVVENNEMKIIEDSQLNIFNETEEGELHMVESTAIESIKIDEENLEEKFTDLIADMVNKVQDQEFKEVENATHKIKGTASDDNITMAQAGINTSSERDSIVEQTTVTMLNETKIMSIITEVNTVKTATNVNKAEENILTPTMASALNTETYILDSRTDVTRQNTDYEPTEATIKEGSTNEQIFTESNSTGIETLESSAVENIDLHNARLVVPKQKLVEIIDEETTLKTETTAFNYLKDVESEELQISPNNISDINITKQKTSTTMTTNVLPENSYESQEILTANIEAEENNASDTFEKNITEENTVVFDTNMYSHDAFMLKDKTTATMRQNITEKTINLDMSHPLSDAITSHNQMESREMKTRRNHTNNGTDGLKIPQASFKIINSTSTDVTMVKERPTKIEIDLESTSEMETTSINSEGIEESKDMEISTEDGKTVIEDSVTNLEEKNSVKGEKSKFQVVETRETKEILSSNNEAEENNASDIFKSNITEETTVIVDTNMYSHDAFILKDETTVILKQNISEKTINLNMSHTFSDNITPATSYNQTVADEITSSRNSTYAHTESPQISDSLIENVIKNTTGTYEKFGDIEITQPAFSDNITINPNKTEVIKYKNTYSNITYRKYKRIDENFTNPSFDIKTKIEEKVSDTNPIQNDEGFSHHFLTDKTDGILQIEPSTEKIHFKNNSKNTIPTKKEPFGENSADISETTNYKFNKPQSYSSSHGTRTFSNISSLFIFIIFYTLLIHCSSCYYY